MMDQPDCHAIAEHLAGVLDALGIDRTGAATSGTPLRWAKALVEMTEGLRTNPNRYLERIFPPETDDPGMVIVPGIHFASLCEHHMLPFTGTVTVGYLPSSTAGIVGLSKLPRMVLGYAARPQVQERLGQQIVTAIMDTVNADGAGAVVESVHSCMTARGVRALGATMRTSHLAGKLREDPKARDEFLSLALQR